MCNGAHVNPMAGESTIENEVATSDIKPKLPISSNTLTSSTQFTLKKI